MSCACRIAPWRTFVQGLAQVHRVDTPANALLRGRQTQISQSTSTTTTTAGFRAYFGRPGQVRSMHASTRLRSPSSSSLAAEFQSREDVSSAPAAEEAAPANLVIQQSQEEPPRRGPRSPRSTPRERKPRKDRQEGHAQSTDRNQQWKRKPELTEDDLASDDSLSGSKQQPQMERWRMQKVALKEKFPEGWKPRKRLSPDALAGIRALNAQFPDVYTTQALANKFEVSAEAIRRILKSKWQPTAEEDQDRQERWHRRGMSVWERKASLGIKPPRKWREAGVARDPSFHEWSDKVKQQERATEEEEIRQYREKISGRRGGQQHDEEERSQPALEAQSGRWMSQKEKRLQRKQQKQQASEAAAAAAAGTGRAW